MKNELSERITVIDKSLDELLPHSQNPQSVIYGAMRYSIFAGGKRLRPILMWETARVFGKDWDTVEHFACALEMIHTYSLIHDDLPAMDNDDMRRGMPTNHIKFGEDIAILAGDALLNKSFEVALLSKNPNSHKALQILARSSGTEGMIGGQVVDLASEGKDIELTELQYIHSLKTGALIRSACVIGAILAGACNDEISAIDNFAKNLGIAFQIRDDILDVTGSADVLGKPIGSDEESNKNTYVKLCGIEKSEKLVNEYSQKAKEALSVFGKRADFLIKLTDYLIDRNN